MKLYLEVKVDTNDGDYVTERNFITLEQLEQLKPLFEAVKLFVPYNIEIKGIEYTHCDNYPFRECVRSKRGQVSGREWYGKLIQNKISEDIINLFEGNFIPHSEGGFHTIKSITLLEVAAETSLL